MTGGLFRLAIQMCWLKEVECGQVEASQLNSSLGLSFQGIWGSHGPGRPAITKLILALAAKRRQSIYLPRMPIIKTGRHVRQ